MARAKTSLLLIAADDAVSGSVKAALGGIEGLRMTSESASVATLNGTAVKMAADHDVVLFATDVDDADDLRAIKDLQKQRGENTVFLALADKDIPLSRARELTDAGVDDVLPYPVSDEELKKQVGKWLDRIAERVRKQFSKNGHVISVMQARGGIGSTTVAVNLADQLCGRKGRFKKANEYKVAILDLDLQFGTVGDFLDVKPQEALMQLASHGDIPDVLWVKQTVTTTDTGLDVIAAPASFMPLDGLRDDQVKALIRALRASYDYVVVDLPRALVGWVGTVMTETDRTVLVCDTTVPSVRAARKLIDFFTGENPTLKFDVVINHEKKPFMLGQHHKEAARVLEQKFEHWLPDDPKAARAAVDYGKPLSEVSGSSALNKAVAGLAKDIHQVLPAAKPAAK